MTKIIALAALAALSACSKSQPAAETAATPKVATPADAPVTNTVAADGKPSIGTFRVTSADGQVRMEEVRADGTYTSTLGNEVVETGRWEQKSPELYCYTVDEKGAKQVCNVEKVDEKGVWTSQNPDTDEAARIERVER